MRVHFFHITAVMLQLRGEILKVLVTTIDALGHFFHITAIMLQLRGEILRVLVMTIDALGYL